MTTRSTPANAVNLFVGTPLDPLLGSMTVRMKTSGVYYVTGARLLKGTNYLVTREWGRMAIDKGWAEFVEDLSSSVPSPQVVVSRGFAGTHPYFAQQYGPTPRVRKAMASPPTVSIADVSTIGTLIPGNIHWRFNLETANFPASAANVSVFQSTRPVTISQVTYPDYLFVSFSNIVSYASGGAGPAQIAFNHTGRRFAFFYKETTGSRLIRVNDEYISLSPTIIPNSGNINVCFVDFGSRATRRIEVTQTNLYFGGVYTDSFDTITPAVRRGPKTIVVGDSYTEGTGAGSDLQTWYTVMAERLGWDDVWGSGIGGTGYLADLTGTRPKTFDRLPVDVFANAPDEVVFALGYNDITLFTPAAIGAEAARCFAATRAALPNAGLRVIAPWWTGGVATQNAAIRGAREAIRAACAQYGGTFVDLLEMPLTPSSVPVASALAAPVAANATTFNVIPTQTVIPTNTYKFPNGYSVRVRSVAGTTVTTDAPLLFGYPAGTPLVQCGESLWTGTGRVGATTGYGNCDVVIGADGVHPTAEGHILIGTAVADILSAS